VKDTKDLEKGGDDVLTCDNVQPILSEYLAGELFEDVRINVESHLSGCRDCADFLETLKTFEETLRMDRVSFESSGLDAKLAEKIAAHVRTQGKKAHWFPHSLFRPAPVAGLVVLAAAVLLLVVLSHKEQPYPGTNVPANQEVIAVDVIPDNLESQVLYEMDDDQVKAILAVLEQEEKKLSSQLVDEFQEYDSGSLFNLGLDFEQGHAG